MDAASATLNEIGLVYGTDKSSAHHNYLRFYESHFEPIRNEPLKILEVGVLNGASIRTWEAYFPNATLIGADIDRRCLQYATARATIEIIDQSNLQDLVALGLRHGPFDIVIEDGSHLWEHQITTLKTLFPFVKDGGIYVVEDLHTSFGALAKQYQGVSSITPVTYLTRLLHYHIGDEETDAAAEEDPFLRSFGHAIETMAFYRHICLLKKASQRVPPVLQAFTARPLVEGERRVPVPPVPVDRPPRWRRRSCDPRCLVHRQRGRAPALHHGFPAGHHRGAGPRVVVSRPRL